MRRGGPIRRMREAGFSLFELILVLFLAGLMAALVVPSFSGPLESARLRSGAAEVRATLALARTLAASGARERTVAFDLDKGEYRVAGEERSRLLPEGIRFESVIVAGAEASRSASVRFFPDGGGEDAVIAISSSGGGMMRVKVDPLTGLARISHQASTTAADTGMSAALRSVGHPQRSVNYASGALGRAPCIHARLHRLATNLGEKCGLAEAGT